MVKNSNCYSLLQDRWRLSLAILPVFALAAGGLMQPATGHTLVSPTVGLAPFCSSEKLKVPLDDAGIALAEHRSADAAVLLLETLRACPPDPAAAKDYHARLEVAALAALASHRAGDDETCREVTRSDRAVRYLYGAASAEELDEVTITKLDILPKDILVLLFQAVALCPAEQRVCAEPAWSNVRQHAGEYWRRGEDKGALNWLFEALARCAADPLDKEAFVQYAWAVSDAALIARRLNDLPACHGLLRRDPALRRILGEASVDDLLSETAPEFAGAANGLPVNLKAVLRVHADRCG